MKRALTLTLALLMLFASVFVIASCKKDDGEEVSFTLVVVHLDGTEKSFDITTERAYLADALVDEGIVSGEDSQYGLYITTVDGEYHKFEDDGKYWALYVGDEMASTGASSLEISEGATYKLKAE